MEGSDVGPAPGWQEAHAGLQTLADLLQTCQDAFSDYELAPKVSSTTKKRLASRALQGLQNGAQLVQNLANSIVELQQAVAQHQYNHEQSQHSVQTLEHKLQAVGEECHSSKRALLQSESQKQDLHQKMEHLQQQQTTMQTEKQQLHDIISSLRLEVCEAAQQAEDARDHLLQLQQQVQQLAATARDAEAGADAAAAALQLAQEQVSKERAARIRHEDAVARLTADNLVFMARLRASETDAAAAAAERDALRLAVEEHTSPWLDEVHEGVQQRVKAAMARADQLEAQMQLAAAQHAQHIQHLEHQQADLEVALHTAQQQVVELREPLAVAQTAASEARTAAEEAAVLASTAQAAADDRAAELRVAQDSLRCMREECNERWISERSAQAQLAEVQTKLAAQEAAAAELHRQLQGRSDELATQRAVNQQLMLKKEEVEWQLLSAIAQLQPMGASIPAVEGEPPVSGRNPGPGEQQKQQQTCKPGSTAATTVASMPEAASADDVSASPFGANAQLALPTALPLSDAPPTALAVQQLASGTAVAAEAAPRAAGAAAKHHEELKGPAVVAASGGLWQLPGGSSSGLFGRVSSTVGSHSHHLAGAGQNMPIAAAVGSLLHGTCPLQHALSCPEGDMYSLPCLGFGLATLPSPEQLRAAAEAAAIGSSSLQKTVTIGRAGSLTVPIAHPPSGAPSSSVSAKHTQADDVPLISGAAPPGRVEALQGCAEGAGQSIGRGSLRPILVGATGGLMAPFTPLSPGAKGPASSLGRGAVFPECITASAVTDAEQADLTCFSFNVGAAGDVQQQQQVLGPGFWYLQQQQQQSRERQSLAKQSKGHRQAGSSESLSDGGRPAHHSSSPCASSGSLHGAQTECAITDSAAVHVSGTLDTAVGQPSTPPASAAAGVSQAVAAADETIAKSSAVSDAVENTAFGGNDSSSSSAGSSSHLHGILLNGPNSRARSPALGGSPCGSLKSVRFSFEGIESHGAGPDANQESEQDQKSSRRSSSSSSRRASTSPHSRSHGASGSEWLRHTLYEQLSGHSTSAAAPKQPHHRDACEVSAQQRSRRHSRSGGYRGSEGLTHYGPSHKRAGGRQETATATSMHGVQGWPVSSHPPTQALRGAELLGRFATGRHAGSQQDLLLQQQRRQQRQQQLAEEAVRLAAAIKDRSQPHAPVHPIFGAMAAASAGGGAGGGAMTTDAVPCPK